MENYIFYLMIPKYINDSNNLGSISNNDTLYGDTSYDERNPHTTIVFILSNQNFYNLPK